MAEGQRGSEGDILVAARAEAEERAHDAVTPDDAVEPIRAVALYVEAFLEGVRFALDRRGAPR